jgi:large subunit ribosomal protein L4
VQESKLVVVDRFDFDKPSTKRMAGILNNLLGDAPKKSALVALGDWTESAWKSGRNLPGVRVMHAENVNVYTTLQYDYLIVDKAGLSIIEGALAK